MLLAREFVDDVSRQIVKKLTPQWIETTDAQVAAAFIANVIEEDLAVEDSLNDEVREMLSQYTEYMRREGVSYQEMFRKIKNTLITQRKVIRAAGRDSGRPHEAVAATRSTTISHKIVAELRKSRDFRVKRRPNDVRLELVRVVTDLLVTEYIDRGADEDSYAEARNHRGWLKSEDEVHLPQLANEFDRAMLLHVNPRDGQFVGPQLSP